MESRHASLRALLEAHGLLQPIREEVIAIFNSGSDSDQIIDRIFHLLGRNPPPAPEPPAAAAAPPLAAAAAAAAAPVPAPAVDAPAHWDYGRTQLQPVHEHTSTNNLEDSSFSAVILAAQQATQHEMHNNSDAVLEAAAAHAAQLVSPEGTTPGREGVRRDPQQPTPRRSMHEDVAAEGAAGLPRAPQDAANSNDDDDDDDDFNLNNMDDDLYEDDRGGDDDVSSNGGGAEGAAGLPHAPPDEEEDDDDGDDSDNFDGEDANAEAEAEAEAEAAAADHFPAQGGEAEADIVAGQNIVAQLGLHVPRRTHEISDSSEVYEYSDEDSSHGSDSEEDIYANATQTDEGPTVLQLDKVITDCCGQMRLINHLREKARQRIHETDEFRGILCKDLTGPPGENGEPGPRRSCDEADDRLDMGVTERRIRRRDGTVVVVPAREEDFFGGLHRSNRPCNYLEETNQAILTDEEGNQHMMPKSLCNGVPNCPPERCPTNNNISHFDRFIKPATEDRKYRHLYDSASATLSCMPSPTDRDTCLYPAPHYFWNKFRPFFESMEQTVPGPRDNRYRRRGYGGGSCATEGLRVKDLMHPLNSYLFGGFSRQLGLVKNVRASYVKVRVPAQFAKQDILSEIEKNWVTSLIENSGVVHINSKAVGQGGYARSIPYRGFTIMYLESITWDEYVGENAENEDVVCPRLTFLRNSRSLYIKHGVKVSMRALGIDKYKEGTVELRCPRYHPVSGYFDSMVWDEDEGCYFFTPNGIKKHYLIRDRRNKRKRCFIYCPRCAQLGFGYFGKGLRDPECFEITRVIDENGSLWVRSKLRQYGDYNGAGGGGGGGGDSDDDSDDRGGGERPAKRRRSSRLNKE